MGLEDRYRGNDTCRGRASWQVKPFPLDAAVFYTMSIAEPKETGGSVAAEGRISSSTHVQPATPLSRMSELRNLIGLRRAWRFLRAIHET